MPVNRSIPYCKNGELEMSKIEENVENWRGDPEGFGGEDFPSWDVVAPITHQINASPLPPVSEQEPLANSDVENKIIAFYNANPQLKNITNDINHHTFNDGPWIQTFTGKRFNPLNPVIEAIAIEDIAHALSNICRFTGHCSDFYSVAQHSVLVSYLCNHEHALYGLLHDASEAYCQDIASPIKKTEEFSAYREVEAKLQRAVYKRFDCLKEEPADVKLADMMIFATEARDLMSPLRCDFIVGTKPLPFNIIPLPPKQAKALFLERFKELNT